MTATNTTSTIDSDFSVRSGCSSILQCAELSEQVLVALEIELPQFVRFKADGCCKLFKEVHSSHSSSMRLSLLSLALDL